eukprot:4167570-Pyramimonas_sp.AAC.1
MCIRDSVKELHELHGLKATPFQNVAFALMPRTFALKGPQKTELGGRVNSNIDDDSWVYTGPPPPPAPSLP